MGDSLKLLNVGYLDSNKNQEMIIKALEIVVKKRYKDIKLYIVGKEREDGYFNKLERLVSELNIGDFISFEGYQKDVSIYYEDCDVFILSSLVEGFSLVTIEAMRSGMPIITTDTGPANELVDDKKNGFVVYDIYEMADRIIYFIENKDEIKIFGKNSSDIFNNKFTIDKMVSEYRKIFQI